MKNLYLPLHKTERGNCGTREGFLRSLMTICLLFVGFQLLTSNINAQVSPTPPSSVGGLYNNIQSTNFDIVVGNPYLLLSPEERTGSVPNPDLPANISCPNLKVIFVLDESGSITGSDITAVRNGVLALANALNGSGAELRIIEFATTASLINLGGATVNNTFIANLTNYLNSSYSGQSYNPVSANPCTGWTNWEDALEIAQAQTGDLVMFFTDGNPTAYNVSNNSGNCDGDDVNAGNSGSIAATALSRAIDVADDIKSDGKHMFAIGVGSSVNTANLIAISDSDNFANTPSIFTDDYSIGNFSGLAANLSAAVNVICGTTLSINKSVSKTAVCLGEFVTFTITVTNTGAPNGYNANNTVMTDVFPAGYSNLQFVGSAPSGATISGNTLTYNIGTLTNGQSKTVQVKAKVIATTPILNVAYASAHNANQVSDDATPNLEVVPPTIECPANVTLYLNASCNANTTPANTGTAKGKDNCSQDPTITYTDQVVNGCGSTKVITRTWKATDAVGNFVTCNQIITVLDNTNPTASNPANINVSGCGGAFPAPNPSVVTNEADNCGTPTVTWVSDSAPSVNGCVETIVRTYKVMDACGNYIHVTQNLIRNGDTTNPTASNPADLIVSGCNGSFPAPNTAVVIDEADNCSAVTVTHHSDSDPVTTGCTQTIVRKYKVKDACDNFVYVYQNVIRTVDTQDPTASNPSDIVLQGCNGTFPAPNPEVVTNEADNCGTPTVTHHSDGSPSLSGCTETVVRKYKVTDACGRFIYVYQNLIRTVDTQNPTASNPANIVLQGCNGSFPAPNPDVVTNEADNCGTPTVTFVQDGTPSLNGCTETAVRTYKVTDACGNFIYVYQNLIRTVDTTGPVFTNVPVVNVQCDEEIDFGTPTVEDNCSDSNIILLTHSDTPSGNGEDCGQYKTYTIGGWGSPNNSGPGAYRTANFASAFPTGLTVGCGIGSYTFTTGNAVRDFFPAGGPSSVLAPGNLVNPTGVGNQLAAQLVAAKLNVGFDAYDPNFGNASGFIGNLVYASGTFQGMTVSSVMQIANDVLGGCSNAYSLSDLASAMEDINWSFHEGNTNSGDLVCVDNSDQCEYNVIRTWTATDACGNSTSVNQVVHVTDNEDPTIDAPANYTLPLCNQDWPTEVTAPWSDNCADGGIAIAVVGATETIGCTQTRAYIFHVEDNCENEANAITYISRTYDVTNPVIDAPADYVLPGCNPAWPTSVAATWTDNCNPDGGSLQGSAGDVITDDCTQSRTYTFSVVDACGNPATAYTTITRAYNEVLPVITPIADYTLPLCNQDWPVLSTPWTSDCSGGGNVQGVAGDVVTTGCTQTRVYTFTVNDDCGLIAMVTTTVTRTYDTTAPTIYDPADYALPGCNQAWPEVIYADWADNCSGYGQLQAEGGEVSTDGCTQYRTYTFSYTDDCGNPATASTTISRTYDVTAPTIYDPADYALPGCNQAWPETLYTQWSDNCSYGGGVSGYGGEVITNGCTQTRTYTFSIVDDCGNPATASTILTRTYDVTAPTIYNPADYALPGCNQAWPETLYAQWSDNCSQGGGVTGYGGEVITNGCIQTRTYTFSATDACGNPATASTVVTRTYDVTAPTIYDPADYVLPGCNQDWPAVIYADWADNCSGDGQLQAEGGEVSTDGCTQYRTYTFSYTDDCGNPATASTTISRIYDVTAPTIYDPADYALPGCNQAWPETLYTQWSDNCSQGGGVTGYGGEVITNGCIQTRTYTFSVTDACGNPATASTVVTRTYDVTAPTIYDPADYALPGCNQAWPEVIFADWADNCSGDGQLQAEGGEVTTVGCTQYRTYTFSYTDDCGNPASASTTISRTYDVTPPTIFDPADYTLPGCNQDWPSAVYADWADNCSGDGQLEGVAGDVITNGCIQTRTYTFSYTDDCGNPATASTVVTRTYDMTAPVIDAPADYVLPGCNPAWPTSVAATWTDNCNPNGGSLQGSAGDVATDDCTQSRTYTFYVVDACGNPAYAYTTITRAYNEVLPVITPIADYTLPLCNQDWPVLSTSWSSDCSGGGNVAGVAGDVITNGCVQTRVYTFTVNDDCGLGAVVTTTVTRTYDVTAPTIYNPADYALPGCNQDWPAVIYADWADNCSGDGQLQAEGGEVSTDGCTQYRTYTFSYTDDCGNPATASTTISRIYDVTAPTIYDPADYALPGCNQAWPETLYTQWSDNCSQGGGVTGYGGEVITNGCIQTRTYTFSVTDACGNPATASTVVTRTYDVTAPTIYDPADYALPGCNQAWPEVIYADWADNCSGDGQLQAEGGEVTTVGCTQYRTYTFSYTDDCGNPATASTTISRTYDVTPPIINAPADYALPGCNQAWPNALTADCFDNCTESISIIAYGGEVITNGCTQTRTYSFSFTDDCGNPATASTIVTRTYDVTVPTINAPADYVLEGCNPAWPTSVAATWTDNCNPDGGSLQGSAGDVSTDGCSQSRTYTFYVMDACGNPATAYTTITRLFSEANPVITPIADYTLAGCNADWPTLVTQWTSYCSQGGNVTGVPGNVMTDGCIQTRTYTFTVLDGCGLSATITTTVTRIYDVTGPVFTSVPVVTAECDETIDFGTPTVEDNCSGTVIELTHQDSYSGNDEDCGQYTTYSKGGWGSPSNSGPGSYRDANFAGAFPSGLNIGCATGSYTFSSATAVKNFLPAGGPSSVLPAGNVLNPTGIGNQLAAQLVAAELNLGFDAYDPNFGDANGFIGNLLYSSGPFAGMTASSVMIIANDVLGGCSNAYALTDLASAMEAINLSFHEGDSDSGALVCSPENLNLCSYTVTRTWTATDACGNSTSVDQVVTVTDTQNPTIDAPANYALEICNQEWPTTVTATWSDNCSEGGIVTAVPGEVQTVGCTQTRAYIFHVTDDCENPANAITYITRTYDVTAPIIYDPADYTLAECNQAWPETLYTQWSDNCSQGGFVVGYGGEVSTDGCTQVRTYTFSIVDACGNPASASTTVTRKYDVTDPIVVIPVADKFYQCNAEIVYETPVFSDNCPGDLIVVLINPGDTTFLDHGYIIHRTFTATDACGNSVSDSHDIFVVDNTVPVLINLPADIFAQCGEIPEPAIVIGMDNCEQELDVDFDEEIIEEGCYVHIERTWTVTDAEGNVTTHTQVIEFNDDTDPYVISSPADLILECGEDVPYTVPVFGDNCDEELTVYPASSISQIECGQIIHRSWEAIDDCGNSVTAYQNITILDTQDPVLYGVPSDVEAECGQLPSVPVVTAIDACDGELEVEFSEDGEQDGCYYNLVRTWSATDACGHTVTATQTIVVGDNTNPYIVSAPAEVIQIECNTTEPALVVEFGDNCDEELELSAISGIGNVTECGYDIARSIKATDDCGNFVIFSQLVQVRDTTDPYSTFVPGPLTIECSDPIPAVVDAQFDDNCDTELSIEYNTHNVDLNCGYRIVRTWTATDNCDNSVSVSQYIDVTDSTPPVFDPYIVHQEVECNEVEDFLGVTAHDNCGEVEITFEDDTVSGQCLGNLIRTYTATDECGNKATAQQIVAVVDTHGPVIENPADDTVQCDEAPTSMPEVNIYDLCTDVVDSDSWEETIIIDDCTYQIVWHWTAEDYCGNVSEATTTITVVDTEDPTFHNVPSSQTYSCEQDFVAPVAPTASDNCSDVTIEPSEVLVPGACPNSYSIVYTWTAYDECGNDASVSVTYYIVDETAPVLSSMPQDVTVECDAIPAAPVVTATDACDTDVDVDFNEIISGTCDYTITRTWTAVDDCGNDVVHTQVIHVQDTVDPVFTTAVADITVECAEDVPAPLIVSATDNCSVPTVTPYVETLESDDCGNAYIRVYYIAVDACGNEAILEYFITVQDTTDPVLYGCPENLSLGCYDEVPVPADVTAFDNCQGEIDVDFEEYYFGDEPTEGSIADCRLITPARPANNPCGYPVDWAMALFGLPNNHRYYHVEDGNLVRFPDGTIHITAEMHNAYNNANGWNVDVWFANEKDWAAFSSQAFPTNFKADCGGVAANHEDWLYFVLQAGAGAELVGFGGYTGSTLNLVHAPANKYFQFQLGDGANNYNAAENAFGGWFSYAGLFVVNGTPYGSNGNISGAGDFAFEMECCPDYYIIRQWTATDCSGNTSTCSQTITFGDNENNDVDLVTIPSEEVVDGDLIVSVSPNPANSNALFTFKTKENAQTTLEVFDAVGKKVADVFMGQVEAGVEYKVNYNVNTLSTGIYLYRLQNGNSTEIGKLIIGK